MGSIKRKRKDVLKYLMKRLYWKLIDFKNDDMVFRLQQIKPKKNDNK